MDTYQAVYDAVRSRLTNCDVGRAITDVARQHFDISHTVAMIRDGFQTVAYEMPQRSKKPKEISDE